MPSLLPIFSAKSKKVKLNKRVSQIDWPMISPHIDRHELKVKDFPHCSIDPGDADMTFSTCLFRERHIARHEPGDV
jgi:hypothetical protein